MYVVVVVYRVIAIRSRVGAANGISHYLALEQSDTRASRDHLV